jgi:hypothetical protein
MAYLSNSEIYSKYEALSNEDFKKSFIKTLKDQWDEHDQKMSAIGDRDYNEEVAKELAREDREYNQSFFGRPNLEDITDLRSNNHHIKSDYFKEFSDAEKKLNQEMNKLPNNDAGLKVFQEHISNRDFKVQGVEKNLRKVAEKTAPSNLGIIDGLAELRDGVTMMKDFRFSSKYPRTNIKMPVNLVENSIAVRLNNLEGMKKSLQDIVIKEVIINGKDGNLKNYISELDKVNLAQIMSFKKGRDLNSEKQAFGEEKYDKIKQAYQVKLANKSNEISHFKNQEMQMAYGNKSQMDFIGQRNEDFKKKFASQSLSSRAIGLENRLKAYYTNINKVLNLEKQAVKRNLKSLGYDFKNDRISKEKNAYRNSKEVLKPRILNTLDTEVYRQEELLRVIQKNERILIREMGTDMENSFVNIRDKQFHKRRLQISSCQEVEYAKFNKREISETQFKESLNKYAKQMKYINQNQIFCCLENTYKMTGNDKLLVQIMDECKTQKRRDEFKNFSDKNNIRIHQYLMTREQSKGSMALKPEPTFKGQFRVERQIDINERLNNAVLNASPHIIEKPKKFEKHRLRVEGIIKAEKKLETVSPITTKRDYSKISEQINNQPSILKKPVIKKENENTYLMRM